MTTAGLSEFVQTVSKSRQVILELLKEQDFAIEDYEDFTLPEVSTLLQNKQLDMLVENETSGEKVYIKYHLNKTIRLSYIQEYVDDLYTLEKILKKGDTLIIIIKDEPNDTLINIMRDFWQSEGIFIILYNIQRLQFNILNHDKVPKHIKLSQDEKADFLSTYKIQNEVVQIPEISRFDPVAQAIILKPGEICSILRPSKTAITSMFYRICI
jgi:DNA-directed RNA polymerase subunit H (RpoH/RPB5)